ncbi:hypothetical protein M9H77_21849 [Catharanthus roseus]|uniref:Uncharacterized protein n=1 Tax=Catharanthus roseus TaxID=4058 RepID=A0ACC0API6_CATRO|nr:hypothetical protein M9H77_21849 [Catharanthus roseus]
MYTKEVDKERERPMLRLWWWSSLFLNTLSDFVPSPTLFNLFLNASPFNFIHYYSFLLFFLVQFFYFLQLSLTNPTMDHHPFMHHSRRPSSSSSSTSSTLFSFRAAAAAAAKEEEEEYDDSAEEEEEEDDQFEAEESYNPKKRMNLGGGSAGKKGSTTTMGGGGGVAVVIQGCQVDKCEADLSSCKKYHQRHKVCEYHAKAQVVIVAGFRQRFCQQCSRFHDLSEFDDAKRSCRRRLAGHNERRRKHSSELHGEAAAATRIKKNQCRQSGEGGRTLHHDFHIR